ncbi:IS5 family transposase [Pontibacter qinzhouensis]|uniref:IS5 family transposase n=1 Tax=Pontibacter qinzhouensis TaxID=2603253 RepID=A0A5C8J8Q5_9BACT|nr:IS5 family transposase [Pontibacter qinzhouensis]TXK33778.1 IS5 family transposase [Pontibacter qinzhouensis]
MSNLSKKTFKRHKSLGLFDEHLRLSKLSKLGDPLEKLSTGIDFEFFRDLLEERLYVEPKGKGGRRPYDYVLLFKILILQRYYNLSDEQTEYQICDRLSFMRFLGLTLADDVPDSRTVWLFRERLTDLGLVEELFALFLARLEELRLVVHEGKIVDASFVEVPRQRNSKEDNEKIKSGQVPEGWEQQPKMLRQKDMDARWTMKRLQAYDGYKNHTKCDAASKLLTGYAVTDASVHDSNELLDLLTGKDKDQPLYADSAYVGKDLHEKLVQDKKVAVKVCEKGYRNKPLTQEQKESNKAKSQVRARVEHVYGFMENSMQGAFIRSIGMVRAKAMIGLMNLTYNLFRKVQLSPQWTSAS